LRSLDLTPTPRRHSAHTVHLVPGLDSELVCVGDAGTTEAGRPSRRAGVEWINYARLRPWLTVDGDVVFSRAPLQR
jgi:hypothetical protein